MQSEIRYRNALSSTCLIGTIFGDDRNAVINIQVGPQTMVQEILNEDFQSSYVTSFSNIFIPFSTNSNAAPSFTKKSNDELDEFNLIREDDADDSEPDGKDFVAVANKNTYDQPLALDYIQVPTVGEDQPSNLDIFTRNFDVTDPIRTIGFKLPAFYAGWGVDMAGRPVPSMYDVAKALQNEDIEELEDSDDPADKTELEKQKNTYVNDYNENPVNWPAGPLDVRWDRYRGVWAASPVLVEGYLVSELPAPSGRLTKLKYTSGEVVLYTGQYNDWAKIQPEQRIWVINRDVSLTAESGTYVNAMWFPNGEYRIMWIGCDVDPSGTGANANRNEDN